MVVLDRRVISVDPVCLFIYLVSLSIYQYVINNNYPYRSLYIFAKTYGTAAGH